MTRLFCVLFLVFTASTLLSAQTIIRVPQDQPSIQAGIDAANNGDTVLVSEGTWTENILIRKKITVASLFSMDSDTSHISKTIIDGTTPRHADSAAVVTFNAGADTTSTLMGFTIRGGKGNYRGGNRFGGGIDVLAGGARVVRNRITGNMVQYTGAGGGGIAVFCPAQLLENVIANNEAKGLSSSNGGGVLISGSAAIATLSNNIITGNESSFEGGGIHVTTGAQVTLVNNTIVYNSSRGIEGVGVAPFAPATVRMMNNICWNPGIGAEVNFIGDSRASHNLIRSSYYGENINVDPAFSETSAYSLASNSPCISNGVTSDTIDGVKIVAPSTDIYGNPRPNTPTGKPDLGAVESPAETATPFSQEPQMTHQSVTVGGTARYFSLFRPKSYASAEKLPVVFAFVGAGPGVSEVHEFALGMGLQNLADSTGFMLVSPQPAGDSWADGVNSGAMGVYDLTFVSDLLDTLIRYYKVDSQRVYLTGLSSGAYLSFRLASHFSHRICAIAPVAGTMPGLTAQNNPPTNAVAVALFMGTADALSSGLPPYVESVDSTIAQWRRWNGCTAVSQSETLPDLDPNDGTTVTKITYNESSSGKAVVFYKINGGAHNWPGIVHPGAARPQTMDIFASAEMFKFFAAVPVAPDVHVFPARDALDRAQDTVRVAVRPYGDPSGLSFSVHFECPDNHPVDTLTLFDDGAHGDSLASDGLFANTWIPGDSSRYYLDLQVTRHDTLWFEMNNIKVFSPVTLIQEEASGQPREFGLEQNYPNPFNPSTQIKYTVGEARVEGRGMTNVRLVVYDLLGREVTVLVDEKKAPGSYEVAFDGSGIPSGVYFYRLQATGYTQTRKLLLLK